MNLPSSFISFTRVAAIGLGFSLLASAAGAQEPMKAQADLINTEGKSAGSATLTQTPHGVLIEFQLENLSAGDVHAFHVHQTGTCSTPNFQSAGGHFNPADDSHGFLHEDGYHAGDMPNLIAGEDGKIHGFLFNDKVTLAQGNNSLLDGDGSALVLHAAADDYTSQPSGDAGDRLLCGEIKGD